MKRGYPLFILLLFAPLLCACDTPLPGTESGPTPTDIKATLRDGTAHEDPYVRAEAARLLQHHGRPDSLLFPLLEDPSPLVRLAAADALLASGSRDGLDVLLDSLGEPDSGRVAVQIALDRLGPDDTLQVLREAIKSRDSTVRRLALEGIIGVLTQDAIEDTVLKRQLQQEIATFTNDPSVEVAFTAYGYIDTLRHLGDDAATKRARLRDIARSNDDTEARIRALNLLSLLRDEELTLIAPEAFIAANAVAPPDEALREAAVIASGFAKDPTHGATLIEIINASHKDEQLERKLLAAEALTTLEHEETDFVLNEILLAPQLEAKLRALDLLVARGADIRRYDELLASGDPTLLKATLAALWASDPDQFKRLIPQKIAVDSLRNAVLAGLDAWLTESLRRDPQAELPWLDAISDAIRGIVESKPDDTRTAFHAYHLLTALDGPEPYLSSFTGLNDGAQFRVIEAALSRGSSATEAARIAFASPWFTTRFAAAVALDR